MASSNNTESEILNSSNSGTADSFEQRVLKRVADRNNKKVFFRRRKGCPLSGPNAPKIDYKDPDLLSKFISEGKRILPGRITNVCSSKQKELKEAIKIARILALMPFVYGGK